MAAGWAGGDPGTGRGRGIRGGLPGPRPDQQYRPIGPQGPAGSSNNVVKARILVTYGTGETGLFQYAGAPSLGNPPEAWAVPPGVAKDPYGNSLPVSGGFATQNSAGNELAQLSAGALSVNNSLNHPGGPGGMTAPTGFAGWTQIESPNTGVADTNAVVILESKNATGNGTGVPLLSLNGTAIFLPGLSAPPATPTGGGVFYTDATGHLVYKGPGGTLTVLANP